MSGPDPLDGVVARAALPDLAPGVVDARVHTGEPGEEHKETLESAGIAATAGGVMYVTTSHNSVLAYDLRTHKRLWQYDHERGPREVYCCGPVNRGVAIAGDKVFMATLDARLVALDAKTGAVKWNIVTHPADSGYSHTSAPLIVGNKVIVGIAGGEYGIRGSVTAYDTESGRQLWRFYTIPSPAEGGWWGKYAPATPWGDKLPRDMANEHADSAKYADTWKIGGSPVWVTPAYDPELGLIYFGTGNPSPSNNGVGLQNRCTTHRPTTGLIAPSAAGVTETCGRPPG